jgi:hypothetical protein
VYNAVVNSFKNAGFKMTAMGGWNALWCGYIKAEFLRGLESYQKLNHFPGTYEVGRKDNMWRNISRMKRLFGNDFNIAP